MVLSKLKRYGLYSFAICVELVLSLSFLNIYAFPLLVPALIFCEIMLYLEISNIILLFMVSLGLDILLSNPLGKYSFFVFLFSFMTLIWREKFLYVSPFRFWLNFIALYVLSLSATIFLFLVLGYSVPDPLFIVRVLIIGVLTFLPTLSLYAYSFSRRTFYEGRYVKR